VELMTVNRTEQHTPRFHPKWTPKPNPKWTVNGHLGRFPALQNLSICLWQVLSVGL